MAEGKVDAPDGINPYIRSIDPETVKQNEEVPLTVIGSSFDEKAVVMFDGRNPRTEYISETELKAYLTKEITGPPGDRTVKVYNWDGGLSNGVTLIIVSAA